MCYNSYILQKGDVTLSDLKKRTGRPPISEEVKDLVVELYKTDMKCGDIARKCNISKTSLFKIIKERR